MSPASRPAVHSIPPHRAFADALAAGLIARHGSQDTGLAQGLLLVPNNRAAKAVTDAFVRRSAGGLLLPRLVPVGDEELDSRVGGALEPLDAMDPVPPAIAPLERLMILARLVQQHVPGTDAPEALRLAEDLGRALDQLLIEEVDPARLRDFAEGMPDLSVHWQSSLDRLRIVLDEWPRLLAARGVIDLADRRNRLLDAIDRRWRANAPPGFVVAAGIDTAAPAVARLLRTVSRLPEGMVVLSALDLEMPEEQWQALGPHDAEGEAIVPRSIESHPQFHLKLLLERMDVARGEVQAWRWGGGRDAPAARSRAIAHAMAPARFTDRWRDLAPRERRLTGVRGLELADPAEEAQAIALAMREALEEPGRTAALVTPDRNLARRVSAHLRRWGIEADDSAGRPLTRVAPGTLLLALAAAAAERFAPVPLLALLKHPLVMKGERRLDWLDGVRALDIALRGPRPPAGLGGIGAFLTETDGRDGAIRVRAGRWWHEAAALLAPLEAAFEAAEGEASRLIAAIREAATRLSGNAAWAGPAGRSAAEFVAAIEEASERGPAQVDPSAFPPLLEQAMATVDIRPPYGQHPRIFIWGLLEARLQHADLMILGGLNEGSWPALPSPDPWLAPRIRRELGLPGLDRRIGLAAHDFAVGLGARSVLVTRARRDARAPAVASRLWLRLEAMTGGLTRSPRHKAWARLLDRPAAPVPARRPEPAPAASLRPQRISVTEVDRLKADPFAFYARRMLGLTALDPVDSDPTPAWRGSAVHAIFEAWMKEDDCDPARLVARAESLLARSAAHALMRALWQPRLLEAVGWAADEVARNRAEGRRPAAAEARGECSVEGIALYGFADRIDRLADGSLAIVDYKTGQAPSAKAVREGFAMQLGLLGMIAEHGGFEGVAGKVRAFEYWSLAKDKRKLGYVASPIGGRSGLGPEEFLEQAHGNFVAAARKWLKGDAPFTAKLHPAYAPYGEYDQLMRLDEWYGRGPAQ